jgi:hypothetical protein
MFVDDRPSHPKTFIVQFEFSGSIDRRAFERSLLDALDRHPLMQGIVGPGKLNRDCWVSAPNRRPYLDFGDLDEPIRFARTEYLNLREEIGLRIWVRHDQRWAVVTTQFHHAACDGIGSYQFLGDLLYRYAIETGETELAPQVPVAINRLRDRGRPSYDPANFLKPNGKYLGTWDEAIKLMVVRNAVLKTSRPKRSGPARSFPGIRSHIFDRDAFRDLRLAAQKRGQLVNDMLVEELFTTLDEWQKKKKQLLPGRPICIMMPLNLRETKDNEIPACNIVVPHFLRRKPKQIRDKKQLRASIASELLRVKHERNRVRFMHMLAGAHHFYPSTLKASLFLNRRMATAILSNTGDPTRQFYNDFPQDNGRLRCGNLYLEDISGVPPMRPGTRVTISIFTYRRRLKICFRCDPNCFSEVDTQELLDLYVEQLLAAAKSTGDPGK